MYDLNKATDPIQRAEWARENLIDATRTLQTALRNVQQALAADVPELANARDGGLMSQLDAVAAVWSDAMFDDDPYAGMTNADVMSAEEMAEYDRDAEFAQDAADEERWAAEAEAEDGGPF